MGLADWLARQGDEVGLACTDVVRSTSLLFEKQTVRYAEFIRLHRDRALARARVYGGRIVDETGDQILAVFQDASGAFHFGCDLFAGLQVRHGAWKRNLHPREDRTSAPGWGLQSSYTKSSTAADPTHVLRCRT